MYPGKSWSLGLFMPPREVPKLRVLRGWLNPRRALLWGCVVPGKSLGSLSLTLGIRQTDDNNCSASLL